MPRIIAIRYNAVAGADLSSGVFQLELGTSIGAFGDEGVPCFSLLYRYPPGTSFAFRPADSYEYPVPPSTMPLVQAPISLAENRKELDRIVAASTGGNEETDLRRMAEGFELMKNRAQRVNPDKLSACVRDSAEVIKAYHKVRAWMSSDMKHGVDIPVVTSFCQRDGQTLDTLLRCMP